jgi:hypothetical protein
MLQPKKDTLVAHPLETCSRGQVKEGMAEKQEPNIRYLLVVLVRTGTATTHVLNSKIMP